MISSLLAVLAILLSVGAAQDEPQQNVHRHRITGQYVTRIHRITGQGQLSPGAGGQPSQGTGGQTYYPGTGGQTYYPGGNEGQPSQGNEEQTSQNVPQQQTHVHRITGKPKYVTRIHRYTIPGGKHRVKGQASQGSTSSGSYDTVSTGSYDTVSRGSYDTVSEGSYDTVSRGSYDTVSRGSYDTVSKGSYDTVSKGVAPGRRSSYDSSLKKDGGSFKGDFGVNRRRRCNRGLIDKTATGIRDTVNGGVGGLMGALSSLTDSGKFLGPVGGAVNAAGHAAGHLIQGKINEIDYMINDAACGIGNMANAAVDMVKTGDVIGGVGTMGKELIGGIGNMGEDLLSQAAWGIGNAANDILGFLGR